MVLTQALYVSSIFQSLKRKLFFCSHLKLFCHFFVTKSVSLLVSYAADWNRLKRSEYVPRGNINNQICFRNWLDCSSLLRRLCTVWVYSFSIRFHAVLCSSCGSDSKKRCSSSGSDSKKHCGSSSSSGSDSKKLCGSMQFWCGSDSSLEQHRTAMHFLRFQRFQFGYSPMLIRAAS